ncbi:MAG: branched-chain amino acid ABC transporter permease [Candidatus Dormibacteria bacterium]
MSPQELLQQLVNGLVVGSVYGLVALGYTMVYGIARLINFSQGGLYELGGYLGLFFFGLTGGYGLKHPIVGLVVAMCGSMLATAGVAYLVERVAYRPLRNAPILAPLVSALAAFFLIISVIQYVTAAQPLTYPQVLSPSPWHLGPVTLAPTAVLIFVVAVVLMIAMQVFTQRTKVGKAMRAIAANRDAAALMGINTTRIVSLAFILGGAMAAAAGVLFGINYGTVTYDMGEFGGLVAFTAAVLGGIGNVPGALVGGLTVGIISSFATVVLPSQWDEAVVFGILIVILAVRPQGILGERVAERA